MPFILALGKQREEDLCEASLVDKVNSRTARAITQRNPVSNISPPPPETDHMLQTELELTMWKRLALNS